jgi:RNA polymerase sigma-70 factor (ECF subfamily)
MKDGASSYNRFLQGDNSGLEELVEMYNSGLILFINGFVNNLSVSEDLAADTFMEILVKRYRFKETFKFKTWLFKIGRNNAYDYLRKQSRTATIPLECIEAVDSEMPEEILLKNEQNRQLYRAMSTLIPDYRRVLHLLYFEDMSYEQAGKVLRKSNKQIKNLAYRAKKSLKVTLEKEGFEYEDIKN